MSQFLTKLRMERGPDRNWITTDTFIYQSTIAGRIFLVPKGFKTDLDSVPRLPLVYMLFKDVAPEAAVIHDWLYSTREVPRSVADKVFREAMEVVGVPAWKRIPIWLGVRIGGGSHWDYREVFREDGKDTYFG